ncbi:MAG: SRPBCC domain-containing protein [Chloroflexota bacterium]
MAGATTDREVIVSRVIDAPRELVFAAFTEREHVENWWVPPGTTIHEYEAAPGGLWRYSQPGPRGSQYSFRIEFVEVTKPTRLVYDFGPTRRMHRTLCARL